MYTVILVIFIMVTLALIGIILVQRTSSDGMGLSGSSSTGFISGRAAATFVTRATSVLAGLFILLSLALGILTARNHEAATSIMDSVDTKPPSDNIIPEKSVLTPAAPAAPKQPTQPAVPRPE